MLIEFAQSARKHRIGRTRVRQVLADPVAEAILPAELGRQERLVFVGDDESGRALEVMAVRTDGGVAGDPCDGPATEMADVVRGGEAMSGKKKAAKTTAWKTPDGQVITEDDAARLAQEFETHDVALEHVEITFPRKAGRPSLAGGSGTSPQVTFRLSPSVRARAERLAADRGTTVSALAREALEQLVKKAG